MKVGDKVVCIFDDWGPWLMAPHINAIGSWPVKGKVYVIEALISHRNEAVQGKGLRLVGPHSSCNDTEPGEVGYSSECFRKLEDIQAANRAIREYKEKYPELAGVFFDRDEP